MVSNVTQVTSLTRSGLSDWVVQRVSAVILFLYTLCVVGFLLTEGTLTQGALREYFGSFSMQVFSTLALLATAAHAWIGMWTVGTDYIRPHYFGSIATPARLAYQAIVILGLFLYVVWGLDIFWSV